MPAIITKDFRIQNANQFSESFGESADTYWSTLFEEVCPLELK